MPTNVSCSSLFCTVLIMVTSVSVLGVTWKSGVVVITTMNIIYMQIISFIDVLPCIVNSNSSLTQFTE